MATLTAIRPARTWEKVLDDLAEAIERRRAVDIDPKHYIDTFLDDRPVRLELAVFREAEIEQLDEEIVQLIHESHRLAEVTR